MILRRYTIDAMGHDISCLQLTTSRFISVSVSATVAQISGHMVDQLVLTGFGFMLISSKG